jgi:epoxide hydrolase-like predicted phosphatase
VAADGLVERLFAGMTLDERMIAAVLGARRGGVRTGLLSNSWGSGGYPRDRFVELFDVLVISGEVGLRKPDPAIYALAAQRLGVPAGECVFVDDLDVNVRAAEAAGMHGIWHRSTDDTVAELAEVLGLQPAALGA